MMNSTIMINFCGCCRYLSVWYIIIKLEHVALRLPLFYIIVNCACSYNIYIDCMLHNLLHTYIIGFSNIGNLINTIDEHVPGQTSHIYNFILVYFYEY